MARGCDMGSSNFGQLLGDIPSMVSSIVYGNFNNGKFPRFPTVFKLVKEELTLNILLESYTLLVIKDH